MTPIPHRHKLFGYTHMAPTMQALVDSSMSVAFDSVNFAIRVCHTIIDIVSSPRYLVKLTEVILETDKYLKLVSHVGKMEANRVVEVSSKREGRIKISARTA